MDLTKQKQSILPVSFFSKPWISRLPLLCDIETNEKFYAHPEAVEIRERRGANVIAIAIEKVKNDIVRWVEVPISNEQMIQLVEGEVKLEEFLSRVTYENFIITDTDLDGRNRATWKFGYGEGSFICSYNFSCI